MDADDIYLPKFLEKSISAIESKPKAGAVWTSAKLFGTSDKFAMVNNVAARIPFGEYGNLGGQFGSTLMKRTLLTAYMLRHEHDNRRDHDL